jgi:hypothetical protein
MKKASLILAAVAILAGAVAAMPSQAFACYCEARSPYAWGWGSALILFVGEGASLERMCRTHPARLLVLHHLLPLTTFTG